MVKPKSLEETVENYVASTSVAMWKYKKYLVAERKFTEDYAIKKAIDYGLNMLQSGLGQAVPAGKATTMFRELASINTALADHCEPMGKSS